MQKLVKPALILYFAIILAVIWTYISYSDTNVDLRFHVATTGTISSRPPNLFAVWAYEKDMGYDFSGWRVDTLFGGQKGAAIEGAQTRLDKQGHAIISVSKEFSAQNVPDQATFRLINPKGKLEKELTVKLDAFRPETIIAKQGSITFSEPETFIMGKTSQIIFDVGKPDVTAGNVIHTKIRYGNARIPAEIPVTSFGLARVGIQIDTPVDFEFTYGNPQAAGEGEDGLAHIYPSLIPNERPLSVYASYPVLLPNEPIAVQTRTISDSNDVTYNFYNREGAWIGRTQLPTDSITMTYLEIPNSYRCNDAEILFVQACLSSWNCKELAHQIALIYSPVALSTREQAVFALDYYYRNSTFADEADKLRAKELYDVIADEQQRFNEIELTVARDYALSRIASGTQIAEPTVVARSEVDDKVALEEAKANHRKIANPLFIFIMAAGVLVFILAVASSRVKPEFRFGEDGELQVSETKSDKVKRRLLYLILAIVGIGTIAAMFYMMQLL